MGNENIEKRAQVVAQMRRILVDMEEKVICWTDFDYIQQCLDGVECTLEFCNDRDKDPDAHTPLQGMTVNDPGKGVMWLLDFMAKVAENNQ